MLFPPPLPDLTLRSRTALSDVDPCALYSVIAKAGTTGI
jgi:hypothetical protein